MASRQKATRGGVALIDRTSALKDDMRLVAGILRLLRHWKQADMAVAARLHQSSVSQYENGALGADLERLAFASGTPIWVIHGVLLPAASAIAGLAKDGGHRQAQILESSWAAGFRQAGSVAARVAIGELVASWQALDPMRVSRSRRASPSLNGGLPLGWGEPELLRVLLGVLCQLRNSTYSELALAAGLHRSTLSRYRRGASLPYRQLEKIVAAARVPMWAAEQMLLPAIAYTRFAADLSSLAADGGLEQLTTRLLALPISRGARATVRELSSATMAGKSEWRAEEDRARESLSPSPAASCAALEGDPIPRPQLEGLVVRLCAESERAAADDAGRALGLARRALGQVTISADSPRWQVRLHAYTLAFLGNALRVANDLLAAEECFVHSRQLWGKERRSGPSELAEWRLLDLEASLRRDQWNFQAALDLLARALALAPSRMTGRILLKRAYTLEQVGRYEEALNILARATQLREVTQDPDLGWTARMNGLVLLCRQGRFIEAQAELPALREVAYHRGKDLDRLRVMWLTARIQAGLGRTEDAALIFEDVCSAFSERKMALDAALVVLDLSILYLEAGQPSKVGTFVDEMIWILHAQRLHNEAVAALILVREAAEDATITVALVRQAITAVERAGLAAGSSKQA